MTAAQQRRVGRAVARFTPAVVLAALAGILDRNVTLVEASIRLVGFAILVIAVGSFDWRLGAALAGVGLILATIDLPRRTR